MFKLQYTVIILVGILSNLIYGDVLFVSKDGSDFNDGKSWEKSFGTIQKALIASKSNDEIWVSAGTYSECITISKYKYIYGGFRGGETSKEERSIDGNPVIIDGGKSGQCISLERGIIDGLYVTNGYTSGKGGGIYSKYGKILNCRVYNNKASHGGGIYSEGTVENCLIYDNTALNGGSGIYNTNCMSQCTVFNNGLEGGSGGIWNSGKVTDCLVFGNKATGSGGGLSNHGRYGEDKGVVESCTIYCNEAQGKGGGIYNSDGIVDKCRIYENKSHENGGGVLNLWDSLGKEDGGSIYNSIIYDNDSHKSGGGIYNDKGMIGHCTVVGNSANTSGSGIHHYRYYGNGEIANTISWMNTNKLGKIDDIEGTSHITYSCYSEANSSDGNISSDPLFVNTSGDSRDWILYLKSNSPCINQGTSENALSQDFDGISRPVSYKYDMGAYEYKSQTVRAFFSTDKSVISPGDIVSFNDISFGNPDRWEWDFNNDGMIDSTDEDPVFSYDERGVYTVSLTIYRGNYKSAIVKKDLISVCSVWYVSPQGCDSNVGLNWANSFCSISTACKSANRGDQIWVANGNYKESEEIVVPAEVELYGGFLGAEITVDDREIGSKFTVIDGQNTHRCCLNYGLIDNVGITKGYAYAGGGILNFGHLMNCKVWNNRSEGASGGISNYGSVSSCEVYCNLSDYIAGGITNYYGQVKDCALYNNRAENNCGGIKNYGLVDSCKVYSNVSEMGYGAGIINTESGIVINSLVFKNKAKYTSGGISNEGDVINSVVYANLAADNSGIYGTGTVLNCIVWNNRTNINRIADLGSNVAVSYSCFSSGPEGTGNIHENPQFLMTEGPESSWDFHLQTSSPCIDTGRYFSLYPVDIIGNLRPQGERFDMGIYEDAFDGLNARIYADTKSVALGTTVHFSDFSTGNPSAWFWDFNNDGEIDSTDQNPVWIYPESGWYSVALRITDEQCEDTFIYENKIYVGKIWYVSPEGNDDHNGNSWDSAFSSIDRALNIAAAGDQVWVATGRYMESKELMVIPQVQLYGGFKGDEDNLDDRNYSVNHSIIDANSLHRCVVNNGLIDGFYVINGDSEVNGAGIYSLGGIVRNCVLYGNYSHGYGGAIYNDNGYVTNTIIYQNGCRQTGGGIYNKQGVILNSTISVNQGTAGSGIYNKGNAVVTNSIVWNNSSSGSACDIGGYTTKTTYSCFSEATSENGNVNSDPIILYGSAFSEYWSLKVAPTSLTIDAGIIQDDLPEYDFGGQVRVQGASVDMGAYEYPENDGLLADFYSDRIAQRKGGAVKFHDISYGNPSEWQWDFDNDGIVDSTDQHPSWTYSQSGWYSVTLTVLNNEGRHTLTIPHMIYISRVIYVKPSGSDLNDGNSWDSAFMTIHKAIDESLEGDYVWVAKGLYAEGSELTIPYYLELYGGFNGAESLLEERNINKNPVIISGKDSYRCITNYGVIDGFFISDGYADDGSCVYNRAGEVRNCSLFNNEASGKGCIYNSYGEIKNCKVYDNISYAAGIYNDYGDIENCLIFNNSSSQSAAGIYNQYGFVRNCTVTQNRCHGACGGICTKDGDAISIENCIVWDNYPSDIDCYKIRNSVQYSCFEEGTSGVGNIAVNPLFIFANNNVDSWSFHLQEDSPCIDAGLADNAPEFDLENRPRPKGSGIDMGAYEESPGSLYANFYCSQLRVNPGDTVYFTDVSGGEPIRWSWDFDGDGVEDSNEQNPVWNYSSPGIFPVSLSVENQNGTDSRTVLYIFVNRILYVKKDGSNDCDGRSWDMAFQTIQKALDLCLKNDCIWVAQGVYQEGHILDIPDGITLAGGFTGNESSYSERNIQNHKTVIDGQLRHLCISNYGRLDGLYITNGKTPYAFCGGIYNNGEVRNCHIYRNSGSGIDNWGDVIKCTVYENSLCAPDSLDDFGGGGIRNMGKIEDSFIFNNYSSHHGGGIYISGGNVKNVTVYNNSADLLGGGIYNGGRLYHSTIFGNEAKLAGAGVYCKWMIDSCIIWNNSLFDGRINDVTIDSNSEVPIQFSCYSEAVTDSCISQDPMFEDVASENCLDWNFHLKPASSCIDSANPNSNSSYDLDDYFRPIGGGPDMGAYEHGSYFVSNHLPIVEIQRPYEDLILKHDRYIYPFSGQAYDQEGDYFTVEFRCNHGKWQKATGIDNWSFYADLVVGDNLIEVRGIEASGEAGKIQKRTITRDIELVADFSVSVQEGPAPLYVEFKNKSTANATSFAWNFDGNYSTDSNEENPVYTYLNPGTYKVVLKVFSELNESANKSIDGCVVVTQNTSGLLDAKFIKSTIEDIYLPGQSAQAKIQFQNIGQQTWTSQDGIKLGAIGDNDPFVSYYRITLDHDVAYGEVYDFDLTMQIQEPGSYTTDWQMLQEGVTWFGEPFIKDVLVQESTSIQRDTWMIMK